MHANILVASMFSTINLIFLVETLEKDGIESTNILGYSHSMLKDAAIGTSIHA